ncbi:hypothetical protein [Bacillus sp. RSS_NA_20]|uniref:hypothetical protein n=1 Tax=Bacillus sp. RSS_NA_20 TaxID=2876777 RepID=UPI001CCD7E57|nr:hypothetical protein [Bacillus sp. RSS_NA_20]MCA0117386.1 hypothetical protein [Bacillus sp. RSS_NA_20]
MRIRRLTEEGADKLAIFDKLDALEFADHTPAYKTGDLVSVGGYEGRVFYIDCARYIEETSKEAVFNLLNTICTTRSMASG